MQGFSVVETRIAAKTRTVITIPGPVGTKIRTYVTVDLSDIPYEAPDEIAWCFRDDRDRMASMGYSGPYKHRNRSPVPRIDRSDPAPVSISAARTRRNEKDALLEVAELLNETAA